MNVFKPCSTNHKHELYYENGYHNIPSLEHHSEGLEEDVARFQKYTAICYSNGIVVSTKGGHYIGNAPISHPQPVAITLENIKRILIEEKDVEVCVMRLKKLVGVVD